MGDTAILVTCLYSNYKHINWRITMKKLFPILLALVFLSTACSGGGQANHGRKLPTCSMVRVFPSMKVFFANMLANLRCNL